jgi:HEAT repeat protein
MTDLYAALPEAQREGMLLSFLKDPLADVRLVGADLAARKVDANEPVSENIRSQIRSMLADADPRLRRSSALLLASLNDPKLLTALLDRLAIEQSSAVRQGLLTAVGQFGDPQVLPAVLREVPSRSPDVAAAAAEALGRIAENQPLEETTRADAAKALANRYREAAAEPDGEDLRESLLTAMGKLGEKKLSEVVAEGLTDRRATVRLAAVNALAKLGNESAAVLEPLVADNDRGVRQAAITAIGLLGGKDHLQTILARTDPSVEAEASVRQQAWDVTMNLLAGADVEALQAVAKGLSGRADAVNQRIVVLQKLADALATGEPVAHAEARRQLGAALLEAGRPAEAGTHLGNACRMYQGQEHPDASPVWREWINALLAADDPAAINAMKDQSNEKYFVASVYLLGARLSSLKADGKHSSLILLAEAALETLSGRLNAKQRQAIEKLLAEAKAARKAQDRLEVGKLVGQLQAADEAARKAAAAALKVLGDRAAGPLLRELRECISNSRPDGQLEAAIVAALGQVPVDMTGYDLAAPVADKIKLIDARLKSYQ